MNLLFELAAVAISLVFLSILGVITAVAIPGLFISAVAPWLDWLLPGRRKS
jgi:hypothetical protein